MGKKCIMLILFAINFSTCVNKSHTLYVFNKLSVFKCDDLGRKAIPCGISGNAIDDIIQKWVSLLVLVSFTRYHLKYINNKFWFTAPTAQELCLGTWGYGSP